MLTRKSTARSDPALSLKSGPRFRRVKRALITFFIVLSLSAQMLQNLRAAFLQPEADAPPIERTVARVYNNVRAGIAFFGIYTGTNTYWRLFSPINKAYWWHTITAHYPDGSDVTLHLPLQEDRTWWQELTVDNREVKINLNMWYQPAFMEAYAQHLCRTYPSPSGPPTYIHFVRYFQNFLPPEQARKYGEVLDPNIQNTQPVTIQCR